MAAPSGTSWGSVYGSYYKLGIYTSLSSTDTQTTVSIQVWLWSKWNLSDSYNTYYFDNNTTSATTVRANNIDLNHSVSTGSGWSTSNQTKLGAYSYTYNRGTSDQTIYCAAKLKAVGSSDVTPIHSTSYTIPALTGYTVSYNANGGSGAPSAQTKYYGQNLTLSSTKPVRTGYTFQGWGTSASATTSSYAAGDSYTANAAITLYAVWKADTYTVTYNANGGIGAPSAQTKTYGVNLTLSSTKPTKDKYNFLGWGVSASSTTVSYAAGATYTGNASITLYAVWELAHTPPTITKPTVDRCASDGTLDEDGTYIKVTCLWTALSAPTIKVEWKLSTASSWSSSSTTMTGTSGTFSKVVGGSISTDAIYNVRITADDGIASTTLTLTLPARDYTIDILSGGKGITFGGPAITSNLLDCYFDSRFRGPSTFNGTLTGNTGKFTSLYDKNDLLIRNGLTAYESAGIDPDTTLEHEILTNVKTPNGTFMYIVTYFYSSKSATSNRMQIAFPYNKKASGRQTPPEDCGGQHSICPAAWETG